MQKKDYNWNPSTCICENSKCLKDTVDNLVIVCDEIINVIDGVSTNVTNTISANVTSTASINSHNKKVIYKMVRHIFYTFVLVTILLFIIAIIFYYYAKHGPKQKCNDIKMTKNNDNKITLLYNNVKIW